MRTVNIHEAKTHLSKLVEEANEGKEVIIAKAGKPMARLVPVRTGRKGRRLGPLAGKFSIPTDFDAPLPEELIASFEGREGDAPAR
jgi:prevent-host-death family protein